MTAPFALDEDAARTWLMDLVVAHELAEALGEPSAADTEAPPIGMTWNPGDVGEEDTVHLLVHATQRAGLITKPSHALLDFEYIDDGDGGRYRWLLDLTVPTPLKLSSLSESLSLLGHAGATGIAAALAILREAVEAANLLLHQLSDYVKASAPPGRGG